MSLCRLHIRGKCESAEILMPKHSGEYRVVGNHIYMQVYETTLDAYGNYGLEIRSIQNDVMETDLNWVVNLSYYDDGNGNYQQKTKLDKDNMKYLIRLKRF